jgi:hypothetical protein
MRAKELLDNLLDSVIRTPEILDKFVQAWTAGIGKLSMGRYSMNNALLIFVQNQEASLVAGYGQWPTYNRYVTKGQKAIKILAPMFRKQEDDSKLLSGFKVVNVFDVSQTDGEDLPEMGCPELTTGGDLSLDEIMAVCPIPFEINEAVTESNGWTDFKKIVVGRKSNPVAMVATGLHEWGHNACGHEKRRDVPRAVREFEAEAFGYIVGTAFGIKNEKSKLYIGNWASSGHSPSEINFNRVLGQAEKAIKSLSEYKALASHTA